jgi:hypothetical protein
MANGMVDTGHGSTATFSSTALSFNWTNIDLGTVELPEIETSYLGTTGEMTFMPGDLINGGEVTLPCQFDNEAALPALGTVETLTVTFPAGAGQTTPANLAGTGFIKSVKRPNLQTGQLQDGQIVFKFDGLTGPTFTAGS